MTLSISGQVLIARQRLCSELDGLMRNGYNKMEHITGPISLLNEIRVKKRALFKEASLELLMQYIVQIPQEPTEAYQAA